MISKEELIGLLKASQAEEAHSIRVYAQHGENPDFLSSLTHDEQIRVKELLTQLKRESETHVKTYEQLISTVETSEQDVF